MRISVYILLYFLFSNVFAFGQQDVGVSSVISPISGCEVGSSNTPINVIVQNYSNFPVSPGNITVRYRVNGGPIVSQVVTTFLLGNASFNFTFSQTQNFSACSQWNLEIWTSYISDVNNSNDTITTLFVNDCTPVPGTFAGPSLLCSGSNNDSLQIIGGTFSYGLEWYTQILPGGFLASGLTNDKYYLNNVTDATNFQVLYEGGLCPDITSPTFTLDISPQLNTGVTSPDLNFCANNVTGSISLSGFVDVIDFWEESSDGVVFTSTGSNANPFDISSYTDTTFFRAQVSSGACGTGYSDTIVVNIEPEIIPGTISGATNVCEGVNSGLLTLSGYSNATSLEWYTSTDNVVFTPTGVTIDSYNFTNLTQTTYFKVILATSVCPSQETPVITVVVDPSLNVGTISSDLFLCSNSILGNVSVSGFSSNVSDWIFTTNGGATWASTGATSGTYDISSITVSTDFRAIISSGTCGADSSATVSVNIEQEVIPGSISGATTVCESVNSGILTLTGNANQTSFEWFSSTDNITFTATGISTSTFSFTNILVTTYYKVILQGNNCPAAETPSITVIVDPAINTGSVSPNLVVCEDNVNGNILLSGFTSTLIEWQESTDGTNFTSTGSNANPYSIAGISTTTFYRAVVGSGACGSANSAIITATVEPNLIPGSITGPSSACISGNFGTLTLSGNANDFGWQWFSSTDNITFVPTGITTATYNYSNILQTTYYKVILSGNICSNVETSVFTVNVEPLPNAGTESSDLTLCDNNIVGFVSLSGFTGVIIDWEESSDGINFTSSGSNSNPYSVGGISTTTFFRAIVQSGSCGTITSNIITVTIVPSIIPGSISGATAVCAGLNTGTMTLSGNANESSLEWYISSDNITFTPTGNTTSTFNYVNVATTTYYKVILQSNSCPSNETPSVAVTIDPSLNFGTPSPDLFLCENNISGAVSLPGAVTLFDWEQNNGAGWFSTGSNSISYDISGLTASADFRALLTSGSCGSGYSDTISVTIEPLIIPGVILGDTTVCASSNTGTLILSGNAFDFGYEWYISTDGINFVPTGNTSATLVYSGLSIDTYFKVILEGDVCADAETPVIIVSVDPAINLGSTSSDISLCEDNITGSIALTGASSIFDWEWTTDGFTWNSTGFNGNTYDVSTITTSTDFRVLVASGVCGSGYSDTISVTVEPNVVPGTISGATTVCATSNSGSLTLSGNANDFGFQWYISTDGINFIPTGNTNAVLNYSGLTTDTYFKVILQGNICANVETPVVVITVDPPLNLGVTSADMAFCSNNVVGNISLTGAVSIFDWEWSTDGTTWNSTGFNGSVFDISTISTSTDFRVLVASGVCGIGYSDTISVTIDPQIVIGTVSLDTVVCSGTNTGSLILSGNANDFGIEWFVSTDNVSFTPSGNTTNTFTFNDLTQTTYYKVLLSGNACSDEETSVITVTVDPPLDLGVTSPDLTLCSDNISGNVQLFGANVLIDWEESYNNGATWISTGDNNSSRDISYLSSSALFRAFVSSGVCGSGYSNVISVTIEDPIISGSITGTSNVCSGSNNGSLNLLGNANEISLEWYFSIDNSLFLPTGNNTNVYNFSNLTQTTYFKVILSGNACSDNETAVFVVNVDPPLNLGVPSPDLILCESNIAGTITLNGAVTIQNWEINFGTGFSSTGNSNAVYDISGLSSTATFRALVSSGACGSGYSDTIIVSIDPLGIPASIGDDFAKCIGAGDTNYVEVFTHNGVINGWQTSINAGANWFFNGSTDSILAVPSLLGQTLYQLVTSHGACPDVTSNLVTGTFAIAPVADAGDDITVFLGQSTQLNGTGGIFGMWTPPVYLSDPSSASPLCTPDLTTAYAYTVIDINGCTNTDFVIVTVDTNITKVPSNDIEVYNIITTNGDGLNDVFIIEGLEKYENNKLLIFDGNGVLLFSTEDYQSDWDGTYKGQFLPDGIYLYAIEVSNVTKHRGFLTIRHTE